MKSKQIWRQILFRDFRPVSFNDRLILWLCDHSKIARRYFQQRAKKRMQQAYQEIVNAQIETMRKGAELLESLSPYVEEKK